MTEKILERIELQNDFINLVKDFLAYLSDVKNECDKFGLSSCSQNEQIFFIEKREKDSFRVFDSYFQQIWEYIEKLDPDKYKKYQIYLINELHPFLSENLEIVSYIRAKPLGYAGDYVTMNYIYDFHNGNYLGDSLYQKLMNRYTCTIKVSCSNIVRKNYIKQRILETLRPDKKISILSVGSGPSREIIELLKEGGIKSPVKFNCLDFEQKAIDYVKEQIKGIEYDKNLIEINFIYMNLIDLAKNKDIKKNLSNIDFLYSSGVFDYFSDRLCKRMLKNLCQLLGKGSELLICNISLENAEHRAYYETFAEWIMNHRTREDMLSWTQGNIGNSNFFVNDLPGCQSYHFLNIIRE